MSRPLTRKGEQTRRRILTAAADLVFTEGATSATMENFKDAAGVSSSQIYHYFADKQALILAVIDYQADGVIDRQEPRFAELDSLDGFRAWRDDVIAFVRQLHCRGGCPIGSLGNELAELDPAAREAVGAGLGRWETKLHNGLRAMRDRGELDGDPDSLATALLAAVQGGLLMAKVARDTRPLEHALDTFLAHLVCLSRQSGRC